MVLSIKKERVLLSLTFISILNLTSAFHFPLNDYILKKNTYQSPTLQKHAWKAQALHRENTIFSTIRPRNCSIQKRNQSKRRKNSVLLFAIAAFFPSRSQGIDSSPLSFTMSSSKESAAGVVPISIPFLLLSTTPLFFVIVASRKLELELESTIITSAIRTFIQLSILGSILRPIFMLKNINLVLAYCSMMIIVAANVACRKSKYVFAGQFYTVLGSIFTSAACTGLFAFAVIIRPRPIWNPQYVIPMVGMLLGNSLNGISITMNSLCIALVEQKREIELYLSFGATGHEAVSRLLKEAVRSGTMPILNNMAIIGIVSIPGMMTGQILGGSPVMQAARYQMLIMYLIAISTFGAILMEIWAILNIGLDSSHMLHSERFQKAPDTLPFLELAKSSLFAVTGIFGRQYGNRTKREMEPLQNSGMNEAYYTPAAMELKVEPLVEMTSEECEASPADGLLMDKLTKSVVANDDIDTNPTNIQRLFGDLSFKVRSSEIFLVRGPSGCGKSQLLRAIARLSPMDSGSISLDGIDSQAYDCASGWRKRVRYVTQYKVDVPGTPREFIRRVSSFKSWKHDNWPSEELMIESTIKFIEEWGLQSNCLEKDWSTLSGGEAQRVIIALSLASNPSVLLLDESTSALDIESKLAVEHTIDGLAKQNNLKVIWVSHDTGISQRYV